MAAYLASGASNIGALLVGVIRNKVATLQHRTAGYRDDVYLKLAVPDRGMQQGMRQPGRLAGGASSGEANDRIPDTEQLQ